VVADRGALYNSHSFIAPSGRLRTRFPLLSNPNADLQATAANAPRAWKRLEGVGHSIIPALSPLLFARVVSE
jgi:hypothetical protein